MKSDKITEYFNKVMILLGTPDEKYLSIRTDNIHNEHRALYKRLQTHFKKANMNVPVKLVKDGNMLWVIKR